MPTLEEVSTCNSIHAIRGDGATLTATRVPLDDLRLDRWGWILFVSHKHGASEGDDVVTLKDNVDNTEFRKVYTFEELNELAQEWECSDWQEGYSLPAVLVTPQGVDEPSKEIAEKTAEGEEERTVRTGTELLTQEDIARQIKTVADSVVKRSPSYTQKIIAEQVALGGTYYQNVALQSKQSFDLARLLTIIGAVIFVFSMIVVLVPVSTGNTVPVGIVGALVSGVVEAIAGLSFLYNKASAQFARFHLFLDRINRASLCHTMCHDIEDKARRQELIITIVQELLKNDDLLKK